jgi:hypothetical protein
MPGRMCDQELIEEADVKRMAKENVPELIKLLSEDETGTSEEEPS